MRIEEWKDDFRSFICELTMPCDDYNSIMKYIMEGYNLFKAQEPLVVHGRWVNRKTWDKVVCSNCSFENAEMTKFCPNCGARMDGGETDGAVTKPENAG